MPRRAHGTAGFGAADGLPPGVLGILVLCGALFLAQGLFHASGVRLETWLGLVPADLFGRWHLWQPLTYLFLHGGTFHLLMNLLAVFMFGGELERAWGTPEFLRYFLITGAGAGLTQWLVSMNSPVPVIGASGAVFGLLLAFGMMFPDRPILLWFILPIPAKYLVLLFGLLELAAAAGGPADGIARFAHLGGLVTGFLYLKSETWGWPVRRWWRTLRRGGAQRSAAAADARRRAEQETIDAILEKIQREGMGALNDRERKALQAAARRGREQRR